MAKEKNTKAASSSKKGKKKGKKAEESKFAGIPADYVPRLKKKYQDEIAPALREKFQYKSVMQIPRIQKIVLNMGVGDASRNIKLLEEAVVEMTQIAGQKPKVSRAGRSVAQFKLREGMPIGCSVTLRGIRMWDFLDRLINVAIPRVRDFRGLPTNSFDGRGNHSMGIKEQLIFTEIEYSQVENIRGMDITTVTTAPTDAECRELLTLFGMPFRKKK